MTLYCNHCCKYQSVVKSGKDALCAVCNKVLGTFGNVEMDVDHEHRSSSPQPSVTVTVDKSDRNGHACFGDEITG